MWQVIAEEDIRCTECSHMISVGSRCLSQMPPAMPDDFLRRKYENSCIECAECKAKTRKQGLRSRACYTRRLNHWYTSREKTRDDVRCGYCDKTISKGASVVAQKIYAWPETELEVVNGINDGAGSDTGSVASGMAARPVSGVITNSTGGWNNLSPQTRRLFQTRGLRGRGLGFRSPEVARRLYEQSVPKAVRNLGDDAVRVCRQMILAHMSIALIWQFAKYDDTFFAYRVAIPRHPLNSQNPFSTKCRNRYR